MTDELKGLVDKAETQKDVENEEWPG